MIDAAKSGSFVNVHYFTDRNTKDQVIRLKYVRDKEDPDQGSFIGMNVDGQEFPYSSEQIYKNFPQNLINETMRRAEMSKRKYVSIPPGDVKERDMIIGKWEIQFMQNSNELCLSLIHI